MLQVALVCNSPFGTDGISMFVINNHRFFGHDNAKYHLIYSSVHSPQDIVNGYVSDWCHNGDKAQFIGKSNGLLTFSKVFCQYLKREKIDVLHVHGSSAAILLEMVVAKWAGAKKIVTHCHNTQGNHNIIHKILRPLVNLLADERLACGHKAGQWMYGKQKTFTVIPNCIDIGNYRFDERIRKGARHKLGIEENCIVLGNVGTFTKVKNQTFLLHLIKALHEQGLTGYQLLLIGHGPFKEQVEQKCSELGLDGYVGFLGNRSDVPQLMMAMDIFCMPSLYEGIPITAIEAQATGLSVLISANVSTEVSISDLVTLLPIDRGTEPWEIEIKQISKIQRKRNSYADKIKSAGYDIKHSAEMLESIYVK